VSCRGVGPASVRARFDPRPATPVYRTRKCRPDNAVRCCPVQCAGQSDTETLARAVPGLLRRPRTGGRYRGSRTQDEFASGSTVCTTCRPWGCEAMPRPPAPSVASLPPG